MSKTTITLAADCTLLNHLLDSCASLIAACRELQRAKASKIYTIADHPVERVEQIMLTPVDQDAATSKQPVSLQRAVADRIVAAGEKYRDVDKLIDHVLDAPNEWHSSVLDDWMRTESGFRQVISRLHRVAKKRGIQIRAIRKLDEDDPGNSVHVHLRQGGGL